MMMTMMMVKCVEMGGGSGGYGVMVVVGGDRVY